MHEGKSVLKPAPRRLELERLLKASIEVGVSEEQLQEQRVSFACGNAPIGQELGTTADL
jgi:hypothetical protein